MNAIFVGQNKVEIFYNDFCEIMFGLGDIVKVILDEVYSALKSIKKKL